MVARLVRDQEAMSSNLVTSTNLGLAKVQVLFVALRDVRNNIDFLSVALYNNFHKFACNEENMIETKRLKIYSATKKQMETFIAEQSTDELKVAYSQMLAGALLYSAEWDWHAIWMIELKDGTHVGELCFKGVDEFGSTEIGYGIAENFCGCGYATEAVTAVTLWALSQKGINRVTAEVDKENVASVKVLEKSGFTPTGNVGTEGPVYSKTK